MKGIFDYFLGENIHETLAKSGLAGAIVAALNMGESKFLSRVFHVLIGVFSAMYLGPIFIDIVNLGLKRAWSVEINSSSSISATGFFIGYLGITGIQKMLNEWKFGSFLRKVLLLIINKK